MNYSDYRLTLDIYDVRSNTVVKVKRGTNTKRLCISFTENGKVYEIADGCTAVFKGKKPDDTKIMNECDIENNTIYYVMTNNTTSAVGIVDSEVSLYGSDGKVISSPTFSILVEDNPVHEDDEIDSTDELGAFSSLMVRVGATEEDVEYLKYNVEQNSDLIGTLNNRLNNTKVDGTLDENSTNAVQNKAVATAVNALDGRVDTLERNKIIVDNRLDPSSPNPVANRVIVQALAEIGTGGGGGTGGGDNVLEVTYDGETCSEKASAIWYHVSENGGRVVMRCEGDRMLSLVNCNEEYALFMEISDDPPFTFVEVGNDDVVLTFEWRFATKEYVDSVVGDIDAALDGIIALQQTLIGGDGV